VLRDVKPLGGFMRGMFKKDGVATMSLSRFIETLLIRDVLSYFIPGMLITLTITEFGFDRGASLHVITSLKSSIGNAGAVIVCIGIVYVMGYLASTIMFYFEKALPFIKRFHVREPKPEIQTSLEQTFGNWTKKASNEYLAIICQNYIELTEPDYYFRKLDRLILLRNFEMGMASVFLTLAISLFLVLTSIPKLFGLIPLLVSIFLIYSSNKVKYDMYDKAFVSFYISTQRKAMALKVKKKSNAS
jgi:hypothetical protein